MGNTCGCLRTENTSYKDEGTIEVHQNGLSQDYKKMYSPVQSEQHEFNSELNLKVSTKINFQSLIRGYLQRKYFFSTRKLMEKENRNILNEYLEECKRRNADALLGALGIDLEGTRSYNLENGSVYQGEVSKSNCPKGKGLELTKKGHFKIGEYMKGKMHNLGRCLFTDGSMCQGFFFDGNLSGQGVFIDMEGSKFEGNFEDGLPSGPGRKIYIDGAIYDGTFKDGKREGNGRMGWANGDCYVGEFSSDLRHGQGRMVWHNSDIYDGEWTLNQITGFGEFQYANGDIYEGYLRNGIRHGKGSLIMADGIVHECDWENGKEEGEGNIIIIREHDDIVTQAVWKQGVQLTAIEI